MWEGSGGWGKRVAFVVTVIGVRAALAEGRGVGSGKNPDSQITLIFLTRASLLSMEACTLPSSRVRGWEVQLRSSHEAEPGSLVRFRVMTWSRVELEALSKSAVSYLFPKSSRAGDAGTVGTEADLFSK